MRLAISLRSAALVLALGLLAAPNARAQSSPPNVLQFQARVADSGGTPLTGPVTVEVRVYDVPSGGVPLWSEIHAATALNGVVNLLLGSISVPPLTLFDGTTRYLALRVGADSEMTPRRQIAAIPFARRAAGVSALDASTAIPAGLVTSAHLLDGTVATVDLANGAVDSAKLGANAVTSSAILDGTVAAADLASASVTTAKLAAGAVTLAALAANSVDGTKILDGSIAAAEIAAGAVTSAAILDGTISTADLANGAVTGAKLAAGAVALGNLAANSVDAARIVDGGIAAADLGSGSVTTAAILDGTITAADLASASVTSVKILDGTIAPSDLASPLTSALAAPTVSIRNTATSPSTGALAVETTGTAFAVGVYSTTASTGAPFLGENLATTGASDGSRGVANAPAGYGVWGVNTALTSGFGVVGEAAGNGGIGVAGLANTTLGPSFGVLGTSHATAGRGVSGTAFATSGTATGVFGETSSVTGFGVSGTNNAMTGAAVGVSGSVNSPSGRAVVGTAGATSGAAYGVFGQTSGNGGSRAVFGQALTTTGVGDAIVGATASPASYAVWAIGDLVVTGNKNFAQPHPANPAQEIHFSCLEGDESGTYFRGTAKLVDGVVAIDVPETFRLASESEGLTVQLTPVGADSRLWIESESLERVVVRGSVADARFHYFVNGVRRGYADHVAIHANRSFVPEVRGVPFGTQYSDAVRRILVENGTLNADFTPNEETATRLGWTLRDPDAVKAELARFAPPEPSAPPIPAAARERR